MLERIRSGYLSLAIIGVYLLLNQDVLRDIASKWLAQGLSGTYSHGPLLVLVVAYLVFKKIRQLRTTLTFRPSAYGLGLFVVIQLLLLTTKLIDVNFLQHLLLVAGCLAIIAALYSFRLSLHFLLPAALMVMTFPVWGAAGPVLQQITIVLTNMVLAVTSLPYYRVDEFFHLPNGIFEVATSCSGLQQFLAAMIIGLLYVAPYQFRLWQRTRIMLYIAVLAIVLNTVRVVIIIFIGHFTEMRSTLVEEHVLLGWVVFGIGLYGFLFLYDHRQKPVLTRGQGMSAPATTSGPAQCRPRTAIVAVLLLVLVPQLYYVHIHHVINRQTVAPISYAVDAQHWQRLADGIAIDWTPDYPQGDVLLRETHRYRGAPLYLYINRFSHWSESAEPINMEHRSYKAGQWQVRAVTPLPVPRADGRTLTTNLYQLQAKQGEQGLYVLSWYIVNGRATASLVQAKLYQLSGMLRYRYDVHIVALAIGASHSPQEAGETLRSFSNALQVR